MTYLTRMGFGDSYTATLPNGDHLTVWPDFSAELCRPRHFKGEISRASGSCVNCCLNQCKDPNHKPIKRDMCCYDVIARVVGKHLRFAEMSECLKEIAPNIDFGVRDDGSFPVRAYMKYSPDTIRAYPTIAKDLPENTPDT